MIYIYLLVQYDAINEIQITTLECKKGILVNAIQIYKGLVNNFNIDGNETGCICNAR